MWNLIQTARFAGAPAWEFVRQSIFWQYWYTVVQGVEQDLQEPPTHYDAQEMQRVMAAQAAGIAYRPRARPAAPPPPPTPTLALVPAPMPAHKKPKLEIK